MIVFLTLLYVGVLVLSAQLGWIRLNLAWKLSPIAWMVLLLVTLFIPMQWGAPSGPVGVFSYVVEIVPAVSGQVVDVPVEPLSKVKQDSVLFQIDPAPFQQEVERLKAALVDAQQQPDLLQSAVEIAEATVARAKAEQELAEKKLERGASLVGSGAIAQEDYEEEMRTATVSARAYDEAVAQLEQARLKLSAQNEQGENTAVAQARELLARAEYDLEHATVRAPADGIVQQLALRPGTRVAAMPLRGALVFVESGRARTGVAIDQNHLRYVQPGQPAEIVLKYLPGMTLQAEVEGITQVTSGGQVRSSGVVEDLTDQQTRAEPYQVVLRIKDERVSAQDIPGGAVGIAAVYTDRAKFTHVIRRVMLRMQAWLNYVY